VWVDAKPCASRFAAATCSARVMCWRGSACDGFPDLGVEFLSTGFDVGSIPVDITANFKGSCAGARMLCVLQSACFVFGSARFAAGFRMLSGPETARPFAPFAGVLTARVPASFRAARSCLESRAHSAIRGKFNR